eukprot:TRINITY_DN26594_c0_g1_i2.p2 TRINITY_DN26594_c0_g1~~TRINITY_DN26594_c0_g1_i2.p2  ORF type:complete len:136 (-),score=20.80 TRINITY_DN26594_c0_g1_i2:107-457(-)
MSSGNARLKELFLRYGKVGLGVHLCLSTISYGSCYLAVRRELPYDRLLQLVGVKGLVELDDAGTLETTEAGARAAAGGAAVAAYVLYKAIFPVRASVTIALTPVVARLLGRAAMVK